MFDLMPDQVVDSAEVSQIMQTLDVNIIIKNKRLDGRRPVIIKGAEKNAGMNSYIFFIDGKFEIKLKKQEFF